MKNPVRSLVSRRTFLGQLSLGAAALAGAPYIRAQGGAMWSDESRPGPIYLQGDHGAVSYRNLVLRPVVK